jgi:hypothetical protein
MVGQIIIGLCTALVLGFFLGCRIGAWSAVSRIEDRLTNEQRGELMRWLNAPDR